MGNSNMRCKWDGRSFSILTTSLASFGLPLPVKKHDRPKIWGRACKAVRDTRRRAGCSQGPRMTCRNAATGRQAHTFHRVPASLSLDMFVAPPLTPGLWHAMCSSSGKKSAVAFTSSPLLTTSLCSLSLVGTNMHWNVSQRRAMCLSWGMFL